MQSEVEALNRFVASLDQPSPILWPYKGMKEPQAHRDWAALAGVMRRFQLYSDSGLPHTPGMVGVYWLVEGLERVAWARWIQCKHQIEMDFLSGRRKHCPPWGC